MQSFYTVIVKKKALILILILIISFLLRLYAVVFGMGSNHFSKLDEIKQYKFAMSLYYYDQPLFFTRIPGPYHNLILYILINLTGSVNSLYFFMIILGTATVYLQYSLVANVFSNHKFGIPIALLSSLLIAIMPWPIKFSVSAWNPNFIIPLTTILLSFLYDFYFNGKNKNIVGIIVITAFMPFFHMIVIFIIPVIILFIVDRVKKNSFLGMLKKSNAIEIKHVISGILLVLLMYLPFLYFDYKNSFYIIKSYFAGNASLWSFKPETLKIISNPIIVSSTEISRFIGHSYDEYKIFMTKFYGSPLIGFIQSFLSMVLFLMSLIYFFKQYKKDNGVKFFLLWFIVSVVTFLVMMRVHEERYTVIWIPVLYSIVPFFVVDSILPFLENLQKKVVSGFNIKKVCKKNAIVLILLLITVLSSLYLNITHYYDERMTNYGYETRFTPSLIFYENIKKGLLKNYLAEFGYNIEIYGKNENKLVHQLINDYSRDDVNKVLLPHSFYSLFSPSDKQKQMKSLRMSIVPVYYISPFFLAKLNNERQLSILDTIISYCNFNMNLINVIPEKAYFIIFFIDKALYHSNTLSEYYMNGSIIVELPDSYIVRCNKK